jgi:hypothetical protein
MTGQLVLFDLEQLIATIERPPELAKPEWPLTGAEKLLRALVRKGLAEERDRPAAHRARGRRHARCVHRDGVAVDAPR